MRHGGLKISIAMGAPELGEEYGTLHVRQMWTNTMALDKGMLVLVFENCESNSHSWGKSKRFRWRPQFRA